MFMRKNQKKQKNPKKSASGAKAVETEPAFYFRCWLRAQATPWTRADGKFYIALDAKIRKGNLFFFKIQTALQVNYNYKKCTVPEI